MQVVCIFMFNFFPSPSVNFPLALSANGTIEQKE